MTIGTARDGSEFNFLPSEVYICNILAACAYFVEHLRKCGQIYFKRVRRFHNKIFASKRNEAKREPLHYIISIVGVSAVDGVLLLLKYLLF
jgi:hypothetical protein